MWLRDESYAQIGPLEESVRCITFAPDGKRLAIATGRTTTVATAKPEILVCDATSGEKLATLRGHTDGIFALTFTPDGKQILSGGRDRSLRRWDAQTGELLETLAGSEPWPELTAAFMPFAIRFSPDGRHVAFAVYPQGLFLGNVPAEISWRAILAQARLVHSIAGEDDSLAFSPDGHQLAWTTRVWQGDVGHLFIVNTASGEILAHKERQPGDPVYSIDYHPKGTKLLTGDQRETLTLHSADLSEELGIFASREGAVRRAYFSADGDTVIGLAPGGLARVWSVLSRQTQCVLRPADGLASQEMAIAPARDRLAIATGSPPVVRLWDLRQAAVDPTVFAAHAPRHGTLPSARMVDGLPPAATTARCNCTAGRNGRSAGPSLASCRMPPPSLSRPIRGCWPRVGTGILMCDHKRHLAKWRSWTYQPVSRGENRSKFPAGCGICNSIPRDGESWWPTVSHQPDCRSNRATPTWSTGPPAQWCAVSVCPDPVAGAPC